MVREGAPGRRNSVLQKRHQRVRQEERVACAAQFADAVHGQDHDADVDGSNQPPTVVGPSFAGPACARALDETGKVLPRSHSDRFREGCGRSRQGLFFGSGIGEGKWWCWHCQSTDQKELISSLDDGARGVLNRDADGVGWPYGPNIYVQMRADLLDWADRHDVKIGRTGCSSGLHWLDKGRCAKRDCRDVPGFYDHTTTWLSRTTGRPALVFTQPYKQVEPAEVRESISDYPSLTAEVGPDSWYGARTTGVYIWNDGNRSEAVRPPR